MHLSTALILVIVFSASVISAVSLLIIKELVQDGETAMVKLQLNQEKTISEFRQLLFFHALVIPGLLFVTAAGIWEEELFLNIGRALVGVQGLGVFSVFVRWWRRF